MAEEEYRGGISEEEYNQLEATSSAARRKRRGRQEAATHPLLEHRHHAQSIIASKALDELETEVFETGLYENVDIHRGSRTSVLLAEIAYSALWWSVVHSLAPMLWFYPLCALKITGFEIVCVVYFSPLLTLIGPIWRAVSTPLGLLVLRLFTLVGVASFQAPSTLSRLLVLAVGNCFAVLTLCATWWGMSKLDRHRYIYSHFLGYLMLLAVRAWYTSFNPIFMGFATNNFATAAGAVLAIYLYFNNWRTPIVEEKEPKTPSRGQGSKISSLPGLGATGMAFGALLFLSHLLFGEVSVISRWAVAPYPEVGPSPYPWGLVTMLVLSVGLVLFSHQYTLLGSPGWLAVGLTSAMGLYFLTSFSAYFAGAVLAVYTASSWAYLAKRMVRFPAGKVLTLAMATYLVLLLASVLVVAYSFVPGGTLTRERTDVLLAVTVLLIGAGSGASQQPQASDEAARTGEKRRKDRGKQKIIRVIGHAIRRLSTIAEEDEPTTDDSLSVWGSVHEERSREVYLAEEKEYQKFHSKLLWVAIGILSLTAMGFAYRYQPPVAMPVKEHPTVFSGGVWAFHFGYDSDGWPSMERAAQLISDSGVDVIGLLETDASRPYFGNHDIASWLSERLHMHVDFGPATKDHTWGALILSKYPIVSSKHFLLPSPKGELAPAVLASVNVSGHTVDFFCLHFGNDAYELDRKLQVERSAELLSNASSPVVVLSDITTPSGSSHYLTLTKHGRVKGLDPGDQKGGIFYRGVIKLGYARSSPGELGNTEIQVGKFRIPDYPEEPDNLVATQNPREVPEWTLFPATFGSHNFHTSTQKYFKQG